ncbi:hypothetical protein CAP48_18895 [Advenella sp. S44]|nr:hypothetical protein CAP48_18895 [Advenella sp. S44]
MNSSIFANYFWQSIYWQFEILLACTQSLAHKNRGIARQATYRNLTPGLAITTPNATLPVCYTKFILNNYSY